MGTKVKLCKTCKYWRPLDDGWGMCRMEGKLMVNGDYAESPITTSADFGCILWEEKKND